MTRPRYRPTLAVGFDAVAAVDPSAYEVSEDARGVARAFSMDEETREHVADAVREAFRETADVPPSPETVEVAPGYIRVRVEPSGRDMTDPGAIRQALLSVPDRYNARHATAPELDGLAVDRDVFVTTYRPEEPPQKEAFLDAHADSKMVPDTDGPVYETSREPADTEDVTRWFAYEFLLPFDASEMYDPAPATATKVAELPVEWNDDDLAILSMIVEDKLRLWPGRGENTPEVTVFPTHVAVEHVTEAIADPVARAEVVRDAVLRFNRYRSEDHRAPRTVDQLQPPLSFTDCVYIEGRDDGPTAEEWITERDLDAVDAEPVEATNAEDETDASGDSGGSRLNPFSD